jgi:hypothetical protein
MIENVMHQMGGIGIFGIISITLFFAFFTGMLFWTAFLKKPYLNSMRALPLDEDRRDAEGNLIWDAEDGVPTGLPLQSSTDRDAVLGVPNQTTKVAPNHPKRSH